jgi:hypothetical protein
VERDDRGAKQAAIREATMRWHLHGRDGGQFRFAHFVYFANESLVAELFQADSLIGSRRFTSLPYVGVA